METEEMNESALRRTGYRVVNFSYGAVARIFAEFDQSEQLLKDALFMGHGITIENPEQQLYFVVNEIQVKHLHEHRIHSPTVLQLLGTCPYIAITRKGAIEQFSADMQRD